MSRWRVYRAVVIVLKETTKYQRWLNPALARSGMKLKGLASAVGMDYTALWKIARGNPATYPGSSRPEYENAVRIGEALGDVAGSLSAADYPITQEQAVEVAQRILALSDKQRGAILTMLEALASAPAESLPESGQDTQD